MKIQGFFDPLTYTMTYVVWDEIAKQGVVIDPVLDYDQASSECTTVSVDQVLKFIRDENIQISWILETHAHADHLSASQILKSALPGAKLAIGSSITLVQKTFKEIFQLDPAFPTDGRQFDRLLQDGDVLEVASLKIKSIHTPGHTPACSVYCVGDAVFTGDALFMPDYGVGRCDFPDGSAETLFHSVRDKIFSLPDSTRVFVGHDYQPGGRPLKFETTIAEEKASNIQLNAKITKEQFIKFRKERDKTLSAPKLLFPSVQINIDAGHLPSPAKNGMSYLKIPIQRKS